ncbi:MAG: YceI family protein [Kofleriaceae bacterium]
MTYRTTGSMTVQARSRVHDVSTTWTKIVAEIEADPDAVEAAKATFTVDMTAFDAGDWLKNRKLRKDFALDQHPTATFTLDRVSGVVRDGAKFAATAEGTLRWRGKTVPLKLDGRGSLDASHLSASASFELDIKLLGLTAPKFFIVKMEDVVTVEVTLVGVAA